MYSDFEPYLSNDGFWGVEYDFAIGTAVIGAKRESGLIKSLLAQYNSLEGAIINNGLVTDFFINQLIGFKVNGKTQTLKYFDGVNTEVVQLYEKSVFNRGSVIGKSCSIHLCEYSWGSNYVNNSRPWKKFLLLQIPFFNYIALQLHKQAELALNQPGKYQELYKIERKIQE